MPCGESSYMALWVRAMRTSSSNPKWAWGGGNHTSKAAAPPPAKAQLTWQRGHGPSDRLHLSTGMWEATSLQILKQKSTVLKHANAEPWPRGWSVSPREERLLPRRLMNPFQKLPKHVGSTFFGNKTPVGDCLVPCKAIKRYM